MGKAAAGIAAAHAAAQAASQRNEDGDNDEEDEEGKFDYGIEKLSEFYLFQIEFDLNIHLFFSNFLCR